MASTLEPKPTVISQITAAKDPHQFKITTFKSPTDCAVCLKFIWGLWNQGYTCTRCRQPVHTDCRSIANQEGCALVPLSPDAWQQDIKERSNKGIGPVLLAVPADRRLPSLGPASSSAALITLAI